MPRLALLLSALCLSFAASLSARAAQDAGSPSDSREGVAAAVGEDTVTFAELDRLLVGRHALSKVGRETMLFLLKTRVIDAIAAERGVVAGESEVRAMREEIEAGVVAAGKAESLEEYLEQEGVPRAEFEESLRLSVLQRELARRDLGIPAGEPVSGEQQEVWLEGQLAERGLEEFPAPWENGIVLRCADVTLERDEFLTYLRARLDPAELREALVDLLRVERMRARMPDLTDEALERAVQAEIQGRRNEVMSDPKYQGIAYEQLLESQGILWETWPQDPAIRQAALARTWVERKYDEEDLRRVYEAERDYFDGRHGEAIEAWVLYLRAAEFDNELIRDFETAEGLLREVRDSVTSKEDFSKRVQLLSEDKSSRENEGLLGWITRPTSDSPTREAIFAALDSGRYDPSAPENDLSRLVGPVRTPSGVMLLWLGRRRPAPAWSSMVVHVARELRRRFTEDSLDPRAVETYLDAE